MSGLAQILGIFDDTAAVEHAAYALIDAHLDAAMMVELPDHRSCRSAGRREIFLFVVRVPQAQVEQAAEIIRRDGAMDVCSWVLPETGA